MSMDTTGGTNDEFLRVDSVTGVPLDLAIAGPGGRSFAFIIDFHIRVLASAAWIFGFSLVAKSYTEDAVEPSQWFLWAWWLPPSVFYLFYHPVLELLMAGRTPGKRWAGVRIVTVEGMVPGAGSIVVRNLFRFVDGLPLMYVVGLVCTIVTRRNQRIGDLAAGTLLIYDDGATPESLEDLSTAGRSSGISTGEAELVQDLIDRWSTLDPEDRLGLARRLLVRFDPAAYGAAGELLNDAGAFSELQRLLGGLR
jgi:uncharacterized RDD family membrane protein YckC